MAWVKKIGYSRALNDWQWMIGTGVYIDDIDEEIAQLNASISKHIQNTINFDTHYWFSGGYRYFLFGAIYSL